MIKNFNLFILLLVTNVMFAQQEQYLNEKEKSSDKLEINDEGVICNPDFRITKFRIDKSEAGSAKSYNWKVVVGKKIVYTAKPTKPKEDSWSWILGGNLINLDDNWWALKSTNSNGTFYGKSNSKYKAIIPTRWMPTHNDDFGDTYGIVKATSPELGSVTAKANVFFEKDATNNPEGSVPNWFYYWKDAKGTVTSTGIPFFTVNQETGDVTQGTTPNKVVFNIVFRDDGNWKWSVPPPGSSVKILWGGTDAGMDWSKYKTSTGQIGPGVAEMTVVPNSTNSCPPTGARRVMTGYKNIDFTINIGEGCGYKYSSYIYDSNGENPTAKTYDGIEGFVAVLTHELEHWKLKEHFWPNGYDTALDCDLDLYPDDWEDNSPIAQIYGFDSSVWDRYDENYDPKNLKALGNAATWYEEVMCRNIEPTNSTSLNNYDWSFDSTNDHQGKNWKK